VIFWCQGAGIEFTWPLKLVPWYEKPRNGSCMLMVDSGVKRPTTVEHLASIQKACADVAVCPDILGDYHETRNRTAEWLDLMKGHRHITRVLCTQGTTQERMRLIDEFGDQFDWCGAGLVCCAPGVKFTDEQRIEILEEMVPYAHAAGLKFHAFGIGCTMKQIKVMHRLGVDSFDSSTPVIIAAFGKALSENLDQVYIGGDGGKEQKRRLVEVSLCGISTAIKKLGASENGFSFDKGRRRISDAGSVAQKQGQRKLFGE